MSDMEMERNRSGITEFSDSRKSRPMSSHRADGAAGPVRPVEQMDQAISEFEQNDGSAEVVNPFGAHDQLMKHVTILMDNGEHRLAINILRTILMHEPDDREALLRMGLCQRERGRNEEALKCFKALGKVGTPEQSLKARILVAETYYLMESDEMALAVYRDVLRSVVKDSEPLFEIYKNIGNIHVRAGDFESAEEFYNKAYTLNPTSDVLMVNYGTLELQRDNLSDAVERFRRAVDLNPNNDRGWVGLAIVHRSMGDIELSWANIERALDIHSGNRTALRLAVEWGALDGNFSVALRCLQDYIADEGGEDAEMCFTLAKIFVQIGRLSEARLEIERVLALDPEIEGGEALRTILDRELKKMSAGSESR